MFSDFRKNADWIALMGALFAAAFFASKYLVGRDLKKGA